MSDRSAIEWTDATWNPMRGCTKVSPGCKHCYAETFAERFRGVPGHPFERGFDLRLVPAALDLPKRWRRGRLVFVNSMSDLFHEDVPLQYIQQVFAVMRDASQHRFQVLTKRAERLERLAPKLSFAPNIWMGVSVENDDYVWRIDHLRRVPAAVRDECRLSGVPFFFKQWGGVMKGRAGRALDGRTWDEMPVPAAREIRVQAVPRPSRVHLAMQP
jgi:protein gp37